MSGALTFRERWERALNSVRAYRGRPRGYLARVEYWVYLPGAEAPTQEDAMHRILSGNPYGRGGTSPIGAAEGLYFSDVRTHIALVLREKNPRIFGREVFTDFAAPTDEQWAAMKAANALVKLSFISEEPLRSLGHAALMLHAAVAYADLGGAALIYDRVAERLMDVESVREGLRKDPSGIAPDLHVWANWIATPEANWAETRGLQKIGLKDLKTASMERDERLLIQSVLGMAADQIWSSIGFPARLTVSEYGDEFVVEPERVSAEFQRVRVMRVISS